MQFTYVFIFCNKSFDKFHTVSQLAGGGERGYLKQQISYSERLAIEPETGKFLWRICRLSKINMSLILKATSRAPRLQGRTHSVPRSDLNCKQ